MIQNQEYIQEFVEEAKGHLETLESILIRVDEMKSNPELINEVFRAVHSIKGTAGFFGLKNIVSLSHAMENVFGEIRNGKFSIDDETADVMLKSNDCLKDLIDHVGESENMTIDSCLHDLKELLNNAGKVKAQEPSPDITVRSSEGKTITFCGSNVLMIQDGIRQGYKIYEIKLRFNRDLLNYDNGPVRLFKNIQQVGQLVDTVMDHSEINSFEDVLASLDGADNDIYLGIVVTTALDTARLSAAIQIPEKNIIPMDVKNAEVPVSESPVKCDRRDNTVKPAATVPAVKANPEAADSVKPQKITPPALSIKMEDSIRVNVQILNELMNMASEMVLGRNQLLRTLENYKKTIPGLAPILQNVDRLTSGMQEKIMQTRMQPVANVFNKFPRIIRDISKKLHKEIELKIDGADVELDKSMIEALGDPITHLVRNAADHGLESPEDREKAGKSRIGSISLKAYHEGGFVNIDVTDDGGGLNVEKIKQKALETSLVSRTEIENMNEQDVFKLIFKPGFSTADKVTDISGRGVGMDVVKTNIEKLGGSIEIYSSAGKGTTIRLVLPLTLAIIQSLIVETGGQVFALPQVNMKEIVRIKVQDSNKIEHINGADVIRLRGKLLPIVYLADIIKTAGNQKNSEAKPEVAIIIVIKIGVIRFGIAVHSILESEETLVKPLPQALKGCVCYSGVTILGDGKTAMILDPEGIIKAAKLKNSTRLMDEASADTETTNDADIEQQDLLLFQCSGNEIFALDMSLVARVEEITLCQIDKVGSKEFFQYRGDTMRIIRPEEFLPVNSEQLTAEKMVVIIPKLVSHPMGILARQIVDNVKTVVNLNTGDLKAKGLLGSILHNGRIVLLLQLYELFGLADPDHYPSESRKVSCDYQLLLAEDTPFFQKITKEYLDEAGYRVTVVPNGKAALECLEHEKFDAVISDINMPIMDGLELVRRIKDNPALTDIPVIALTSLTGESNEKYGINSGFDYYEYKLDRDHLLNTLDMALNKKNGGEIAC